MKKAFLSLLLIMAPITMFAQLKVNSDGTTCIGRRQSYTNATLSVGNHVDVSSIGKTGITSMTHTYSPSSTRDIGLYGMALSDTSHNAQTIGVMGHAGLGNSGRLFGVVGSIKSGYWGAGVYGSAGASGTLFGNIMTGAYAGYFEGATYVNGSLTATEIITPSDINLKENIVSIGDEDSSLANLMEMNVIKYNYKPQTYTAIPKDEIELYEDEASVVKANEINKREILRMAEQKHYGLSAQELQKIYPDLVRESQNGTLGVNYIELIPILIRSIQELKQELDEVKGNGSRMTRSMFCGDNNNPIEEMSGNVLYQNTPNPFKEQTTIRFSLADDVRDATIWIFDLSGKMLKKLPISSGETSVKVNSWELGEGMFLYTLMVNGQEIDTKKMIITR